MKCSLCPRECFVDRDLGQVGFCGMTNKIKIARADLHMWEEPCISGDTGSGTIFFSGCTLRCVFCQNKKVARGELGKEISEEKLSEIFFELKEKGANNINFVTPNHYVKQIIKAIDIAKNRGFDLPFVYNTSSYEKVDTLKMLDGYIDIYLADLKYIDENLSFKYSKAKDYFEYAKLAIEEMYNQVGNPIFDDNNIMKRGIIVRHLVLPNCTKDSKNIIKYLYEKYKDDIFISIMNQYTPMNCEYEELNRKITKREYNNVVDYAIKLGVENGFIQEGETANESFIPEFE